MAVPRIKTFANAGTILPTDLNSIQDDYGSRLDAVYTAGGHNADGVVRRGKSIIAATESRTNTAYGLLTTPDRVQVVLPADGLICVAYQATWQESVNAAARAAIFVGANQLKRAPSAAGGGPVVQETAIALSGSGTAGIDWPLWTQTPGLASLSSGTVVGGASSYTGDVTTGQIVGTDASAGQALIFAAAGTYDVSVQFKASSGSVTAKNRKLWVWTMGF